MADNNSMQDIARNVVKNAINCEVNLSVAESCTGGLISKLITDIPGSSNCFSQGLVTYSDVFHSGTTTPSETIILKASSTSMSISITSSFGIIMIKPEVGLGVVGTNVQTTSEPVFFCTSPRFVDV